MISCKLTGGLGNQMFQIAATHALALRNNDTAGFDLEGCYTPNQGNPSTKYRNNVLAKISDFKGPYRVSYSEPRFGYEELPYAPNLLLEGYFQSEKYFIDYKNEILDLFVIPDIDLIGDIFNNRRESKGNITSVHIRRGDYLKNLDFHQPCSVDYYKTAIESIGDSNFLIISDDINWCKENFKGENIFFSDYKFNNELWDFTIMCLSDNNIIANSSFSWWGAYLNRNPNKKIIAPKKENWFGLKGPKDTEDIIPNNWITIDK